MNHQSETIGLIGVGLLGSAIAERLLQKQFHVVGFDLRQQALSNLQNQGGDSATSLEDVVHRSQRIILCLPTSSVVDSVVNKLEPLLTPASVLLDVTTGEPTATEATAERLLSQDVVYIDATVAGSSQHMREGRATMMVGGNQKAIDRNEDLLQALSQNAFYVGDSGNGARMKLVVNLVLGLHRAVLAEGLALAESCGIDPQQALTILKSSPAYSAMMDSKGDKMIQREFSPQAKLSQHLKDVHLIQSLGNAAGQTLPLTVTHQWLLERAIDLGYADLDNSAILQTYKD